MIPAMATVSLGGDLTERIRAIAGAGFRGLELFDADQAQFGGTPTELRRMIEGEGLALLSYFPLRDFEGMQGTRRAEAFVRAESYLDLAAELGAEMVMACSNTHPESSPDADRIAGDLRDLGDLAVARGLRVAYEGLAWGRHVHDYRVAWELVRRAGHPDVGLVLDTFHILAPGLDPSGVGDLPPERVFLVQVSDAPPLDLDYLAWSRHHRTLPGRGAFPLAEFVRALRSTGYDGVVSLECFSDQLKADPPRDVARAGREALDQIWTGPADA